MKNENKLEELEDAYISACRDRDTAWEGYIAEKDRLKEEERKKNIRERLHEKKSNSWAAYNIARKAAENAKEVECKAWADHIKASNDCRKYEEDN